jgi:hypothetical protein
MGSGMGETMCGDGKEAYRGSLTPTEEDEKKTEDPKRVSGYMDFVRDNFR